MLGEEGREAGEGGKGVPEANVPTFLVRGGRSHKKDVGRT